MLSGIQCIEEWICCDAFSVHGGGGGQLDIDMMVGDFVPPFHANMTYPDIPHVSYTMR